MRKLAPTDRFNKELNSLDKSIGVRIADSISKIQEKPELGKPLKHELAGYFSEHVGGYRIIYQYDDKFIYLQRCRKRNDGY